MNEPLTADAFDVSAVEASLAGTEFRGQLHHLRLADSTQTLALTAAQAGAQTGVWVADEQTAGRGRGRHTWHSAPGDGLYVSVLVRPELPLAAALRLSLAAGLAAQGAIHATAGFAPRAEIDLRWPNDLLLHTSRGTRKVGGILVETAATPATAHAPGMLRHAVIGIGINCNHRSFPPELEAVATSLRRESADRDRPVQREPLLGALLQGLQREIELLLAEHRGAGAGEDLNLRFAAASSWVEGKHVHVPEDGGYTGVTAGLNAEGFLRVLTADGAVKTVRSGGVREHPEMPGSV